MPNDYREESYRRHREHLSQQVPGTADEVRTKPCFRTDTVDAWRHQRMYAVLDPILNADPAADWLTLGDGRFGNDARYILDHGGKAVASDLSDVLLKEAQSLGFIPEYRAENAEALSLADGAVDYVLCKEAFHHFPRPMVALYEMLRVVRKAVVLIEPNDEYSGGGLVQAFGRTVRECLLRLLGRNSAKHGFEPVGNYVYCLSRRELEKALLALGCRLAAFRGLNDSYTPGVEDEPLAANGPLGRRTRRIIRIKDLLGKVGLWNHGVLAAVLFKTTPPQAVLDGLAWAGYEIVRLPENPYQQPGSKP
jgi:SAM-dependent methyltransferase